MLLKKYPALSLRIRIFLSMIVLIIVAPSYWLIISIIQFKNEAKEYHQNERKENAGEHINYVLHQLIRRIENLDLILRIKFE
jgi:ABC-type glycerol-3-phosphate transport system permease component